MQLTRCPECTLVYADPQAREAVRTRYIEEYDLAAHFEELSPRKEVLFERRLEAVGPPAEGRDRLCDVGCADGQFLAMTQMAGWKASGIELNPPAVARARQRGLTVYEGPLEELQALPWKTFDVVTCWDVLEHTPTPRLFARKLSRLVAPGGSLFITTLNWQSLVRRLRRMRWSMVADEHFTYWTATALRRLFEGENMEVDSMASFGLGRDLVSALDSFALRIRHAVPTSRQATGGRPTWDTSSAVLLVVHAANAALRRTGAGVGLAATFKAPPG